MKSSIYNVYTKDDTGYTVFNTATWAVGHMDEALKTLLEKDPDSIPEDIISSLLENGFIVKDNDDERKKLAYHFDKDKYNVIPLDFMYIVAVTYACNLRCPYCYEGYEKDSTLLTNKKVDILLKNIDKTLKKRDFREFQLGLYGGEPLLGYNQCMRLMEGSFNICEEQGKQFSGNIVTNGVLITEEVITNLLVPYCDLIQITMDGGRTAHNRRRILKNGGETYDILLDVIELLNNAGITPDIRLNVDRENAHTFGDLFKDVRERGLTDIRVSLGWIHPPDERVLGEGCPGYSDLCFSHKEMADFEEIIFNQMDELDIFYEKPRLSKHSPCTFDREDIYLVDPYLDLYNCWEFLGQKDKKVGCITKDGETVFHYEYYEQMSRNPFAFAECSNCVYLPLCGGGCAARAYLENGTYHSPSCGRYTYTAQKCIDAYIREQ
jgi:uncharacterized protein